MEHLYDVPVYAPTTYDRNIGIAVSKKMFHHIQDMKLIVVITYYSY